VPRTVVVTGASAGVGRVTARTFAAGGARVALIARGRAGLEAAAREVEAAGGRALAIQCDVADADAVEAAAAKVDRELGEIDVWVNCAMTAVLAEVMETPSDEFRRVMDVNFLGYVHGTQAALRRMLPRDRGTVVFVGSALAERGIPLQATYCSAKHAVSGFFDSLRAELRHHGANVHLTMVICRGSTRRSSGGSALAPIASPARSPLCTSPRWQPARSSGRPHTGVASSGLACRRSTRSSATDSHRGTWTAISRSVAMTGNRPQRV
jgi:NAD(P)-dependent dehydrogenase (short-subunit alcohol dehydrogenase family)